MSRANETRRAARELWGSEEEESGPLLARKTLVNIFQDTLTLEYGEQSLSRYSVEWQPDDKHLLRVGNPRLMVSIRRLSGTMM